MVGIYSEYLGVVLVRMVGTPSFEHSRGMQVCFFFFSFSVDSYYVVCVPFRMFLPLPSAHPHSVVRFSP